MPNRRSEIFSPQGNPNDWVRKKTFDRVRQKTILEQVAERRQAEERRSDDVWRAIEAIAVKISCLMQDDRSFNLRGLSVDELQIINRFSYESARAFGPDFVAKARALLTMIKNLLGRDEALRDLALEKIPQMEYWVVTLPDEV